MARLELELSNGRTAYVEDVGQTDLEELDVAARLIEDFEGEDVGVMSYQVVD